MAKLLLPRGLRDHDTGSCSEMQSRTERAHRHVQAAIERGEPSRTVNKLRGKLNAFKATMNAMGCRPNGLGRPRRRRR